jgi:amidase
MLTLFAGRADRTDDPFRPPSNTFEMDGTSNVPVELPAVKFSDAREDPRPQFHPQAHPQGRSQSQPQSQFHSTGSMSATPSYGHPVQPAGPVDPRANLNASLRERQQHTYVNHWNQYRALGQDER